MQKITTDSQTLGILRLFDDSASMKGASLQDEQSQEAFINDLRAALADHRKNAIAVYGLRVQAMFAYVAGSMGQCTTITEEDSGLFLADSRDLRRPDFHLITKGGAKFFVEVKSFSPGNLLAPFKLKASYLAKLRTYAERFGHDLKIAVYWRHVEGMWTLVDARYLDHDGDKRTLSFFAAMKRNEMSTLGDCMVGTVPPLAIKVYTDPAKLRRVAPDGSTRFTISRVTLCAAGREIDDPVERELAGFLMEYGKWTEEDVVAHVEDGELISIEMRLAPKDNPNPEQDFVTIGWLSQMISNQYRDLTAASGKVSLLTPSQEPADLGARLYPPGLSKVLRLWLFRLEADYDDISAVGGYQPRQD